MKSDIEIARSVELKKLPKASESLVKKSKIMVATSRRFPNN